MPADRDQREALLRDGGIDSILVHHEPMITCASFPEDLNSRNQDDHPYYPEVFGEAEPLLDMAHAEVIPAGGSAAETGASPQLAGCSMVA